MPTPIQILSQRDPKWANIKLGFSENTIGTHGCTVTALAMRLGTTPDIVNEKLRAVKGFLGALVVWTKIDAAFPGVKFEWRGTPYDNDRVKANLPCLVEVSGKRIGAVKHWVLFLGNQEMADPWVGKIRPSNYYPPTGYAIIKGSFISPMPDGSISLPKTKFEELVTKSSKYDDFVSAGFDNAAKVVQLIKEYNQSLSDKNADIKRLEGLAEAIRKAHNAFVSTLADDKHLHTVQEELQILTEAEKAGQVRQDLEDLQVAFGALQTTSAETESNLNAEIKVLKERLQIAKSIKDVKTIELLAEIVSRLKQIIKKRG